MRKPLLSVKIKNAFRKTDIGERLEIDLKNVIINHEKKGCSGFITYPGNNACVYINTDCQTCTKHIMYRYAENENDFTGGTNRWCNTIDELVESVMGMLTTEPSGRRW